MTDIQYDSTIVGGREVSRPYRVFRRETASGFYPFGVAKRLFFMFFVFDSIDDSATMHNHSPQ